MANETQSLFYVHRAGSVGGEPEPRSWDDIVVMARTGQMTPETLIFFADQNQWRRAGDTPQLAQYFTERPRPAAADPADGKQTELREEYNLLLAQVDGATASWSQLVQLAELAIAVGDREAGVRHFQKALDNNRYHPGVVRKVKQCLEREEWQSLRYIARVSPIWDDFGTLIRFPVARGPLYLAALSLVFAGLFWIPAITVIPMLLLYLVAAEVIRVAADGETCPPLWHGIVENPTDTVLKSIGVAMIIVAEVFVPFFVLAMILAATSDASSWTFIQKSPILIVVMGTVTLLYVPAVLVLASGRDVDVKRIANPREVIAAITRMETEYVASIGILAGLVAVWGVLAYFLTLIPYAGHVVAVAVGVYILLCSGYVVGRLRARFSEQLD